jgi:hypothetical protein
MYDQLIDRTKLHWSDPSGDVYWAATYYQEDGARRPMCKPRTADPLFGEPCPLCSPNPNPPSLCTTGPPRGADGPCAYLRYDGFPRDCEPRRAWTVARSRKGQQAEDAPAWQIGEERTTGQESPACNYVPGHVMGTLYSMVGVTKFPGTPYQAVIVNDRLGRSCDDTGGGGRGVVYAWSTDGLWIGDLFENRTPSPVWNYGLTGDAGAGSIYTDGRTGDILYFGGSMNQIKVYRVSGWDRLVRKHGTVAP